MRKTLLVAAGFVALRENGDNDGCEYYYDGKDDNFFYQPWGWYTLLHGTCIFCKRRIFRLDGKCRNKRTVAVNNL